MVLISVRVGSPVAGAAGYLPEHDPKHSDSAPGYTFTERKNGKKYTRCSFTFTPAPTLWGQNTET